MFSSHKDTHQDIVNVVGTGDSIEQAMAAAVSELTERTGHHDDLHFRTLEVLEIQAVIDSPGPGQGGRLGKFQVVLRACGAHVHGQQP